LKRLLLTNDDGIDAPGLAALATALKDLPGSAELTVVAPDRHLSGCSHQVTGTPLSAMQVADRRFAIDGTPADCTRVGLLHLAEDVDWVLSGINDGGNLGVDVFMSGTVAAVREAVLFGRPGIAFSQFRRNGQPADWNVAASWVLRVIEVLATRSLRQGAFWNVNFPDPQDAGAQPEIVFCRLDLSHLPVRYEQQAGKYHFRSSYEQRPRLPGHDVDVCFSGQIAVTQIVPIDSILD